MNALTQIAGFIMGALLFPIVTRDYLHLDSQGAALALLILLAWAYPRKVELKEKEPAQDAKSSVRKEPTML